MMQRRATTSSKRHRELVRVPAVELAKLLAQGTVSAEAVTRAFLDHIAEADGDIQAWAHLDPEYALAQAAMLDRHRQTGRAIGPLHGIPFGVKDIIDVRGLPCENGTVLDAGRRPRRDAFVVTRLREAGAVIMGKTMTTELAVYHPAATRNPHDPTRTPGGSSSGSAAAVAASMVPLALGTQTNGSVIRPASFCGIVGYKPSRGLVSRTGVLTQSPALDTLGAMARTVEDAAFIADAIADYDEADPAMRLAAAPRLLETALARPPVKPMLAFVRSPVWDKADDDTKEGFAELVSALGHGIDEIELPAPFARAHEFHRTIMFADIAKNFQRYYEADKAQLSGTLRGMIEEGRQVLAVDYARAHDWMDVLNLGLEEIFKRYDALVTPAATGEAPRDLDSTGSPIFSTIWTFCGVPAVTVPLLTGANGMPIGVQLVGRRGQDARLLRTARWLVETLRAELGQAREVA